MIFVEYQTLTMARIVTFLFLVQNVFTWADAKEMISWPEKLYNPSSSADDLVLPMPCGGAMTFRKILVPADGLIGDRRVMIGGHDSRFGALENSHFEYIGGSFSESEDSGPRFFYLGKYEVTQMQFEALKGDCPEKVLRLRAPIRGISWFDALNFSRKYTEWLLLTSPDSLPKEDGQPGFVRLPTEVEWEFSARGGVAVSESDFERRTFPLEGEMYRYVWFQGTKSANGEVHLAGLLEPNPLGLHDVLGNVDEIVFEPFRINRLSRLQGQAGGYIVKGGNYLTSEGDIRSSYRQEIPYFDRHGQKRSGTTGFRVAISTPVITSGRRLRAIKSAWQHLRGNQVDVSGKVSSVSAEDPFAGLDALRRILSGKQERSQLNKVALTLRKNIAARNEQRDRVIKSMLRLGAFLGQKILDDSKRLRGILKILEARRLAGSSRKAINKVKRSWTLGKATLQENLNYYADVVGQMAQEYTDELLFRQRNKLVAEFESRNLAGLVPFVDTFVGCVNDYKSLGEVNVRNCTKNVVDLGGLVDE